MGVRVAGLHNSVPSGDEASAHDRGAHDRGERWGEPRPLRVPSNDGGTPDRRVYGSPVEPAWAIRRPDLVGVLDAGRPVTVVRGGSGFGKSMLVAQWANRTGIEGVWIDVDTDVADRSSFWNRLFAMIEDAGIQAVEKRWIPLREQIGAGTDVRRYLTRFASHLDSRFTIVVDNAHELDGQAVEDDLRAMLRVTDRLRVVIVTRGTSSFERTGNGAALDIAEIEPRRLLFTARECALVIVRSVLTVDAQLAQEVHAITGGMPLATRLVAELLDGGNRLGTSRETDVVITRVADALISSAGAPTGEADADFWSFLQRASLLDGVTAVEAARLGSVDPHQASGWLDRARSLGFGFWESDGHEPRFHFVPITARVLERSVTAPDRARTQSAEAAAAEVLWSRGDARAAWERALRTEQYSLAERILRSSFTVVSDDAPAAFEPLLAVPTSKLRRFPFLMTLLGVAHALSGKGRSVASAYLTGAEQFARGRLSDVSGDERLAMLAVRLIALRSDGRWAPALSVAADAIAAAERADVDERAHTPDAVASTLLHAAITLLAAGQYASAVRTAERALVVPRLRPETTASIRGVLAAAHALRGAVALAEEHLVARARMEAASRSSWAALAEIIIRLEAMDFGGAAALLDALSATCGPEVRSIVLPVRAFVDAVEGRALTSIGAVTESLTDRERVVVPPLVRSALTRVIVVLYLSVGALAHAKSAVRSFDKNDPAAAIARAQIALVEDKSLEAVAMASDALAVANLRPRVRAELLLARAAASLRLGGERASVHDLSEAVQILENDRLRTPWFFLVESDRVGLAALARGAGIARPALLDDLAEVPVLFTRLESFLELTAREREVLALLVSGLSVSVIARKLVVSPNTVKKQRASIYRKLGATTREEAAIAAIARGLLDR